MIIYCDGDSWTAGDILDPKLKNNLKYVNDSRNDEYRLPRVWPGMLDYKSINKSEAGSSNDAIVRRVYRNVLSLLKKHDPKDLFVIVGWSSPERKDFYYRGKSHNSWDTLYPAQVEQDFSYDKDLKEFYRIYLEKFWNEEEYLERYIQQNLSLHHFLVNKNIKHLFFDTFYEAKSTVIDRMWKSIDLEKKIEEWYRHDEYFIHYKDEFTKLREEVFVEFSMKDFLLNTYRGRDTMFDGQHPNEKGHRHWAVVINKLIKDRL